jgi:hypothetical protein
VRGALNLASRPFRNETLPNLAFLLAGLALVALSAQHARLLGGILSGVPSQRVTEVASLETELGRLRREARDLGASRAAPDRIAEWAVVKGIVDRRVFSWSRLLQRLGAALPAGARVVAITPRAEGARVRVELVTVARSRAEGFEIASMLRDRGGFGGVYPVAVARTPDGERFTYTFWYEPERAPAAAEAGTEGHS